MNDWFHLRVPIVCVSPTPTLPTRTSINPHGTHPIRVDHPALKTTSWRSKGGCHQSYIGTRYVCGGDIDRDRCLVVTSIWLKLQSRPKEKRGRRCDVKCLQEEATKANFANTIEQGSQRQRTDGSIEDRWKELKQCILESGKNTSSGRRINRRNGLAMAQCRSLRQRGRLTDSGRNVEQMQEDRMNIGPSKRREKGSKG